MEDYSFLRSFTFGGFETKHLFQIAQVKIPFLSKENEFYTVGNTDGQHFKSTRLGDYTITVDGFIIKDNSGMQVSETKDELVRIINSDEPKRLIFDMLPDRYFNAIYTGVQEYDATDLDYTPLTLVFTVPEARAFSIEPNSFSNVTTKGSNLMLDSEFKAIKKYYKSWTRLLDEKYQGSNIIGGDFTTGIPDDIDTSLGGWWFQQNAMTRRNKITLPVGTPVSFGASYRVNAVTSGQSLVGRIILEEWGGNPLKLLYRHMIDIPATVTSGFVDQQTKITIKNKQTTGLNLALGIYGDRSSIDYSKPMFQVNAPTPMVYQESNLEVTDVLEVNNTGTYKSYPVFTFQMNGENGLVALAHENDSLLQFGNPQDVDVKESERVEYGVHQNFWGNTFPSGITVNSGFDTTYPNLYGDESLPNLFQGGFNMTSDVNTVRPTFPNTDTGVWNGSSMVIPITPPQVNDRTGDVASHIRFGFKSRSKVERGRIEFNLQDETGTSVISATVRDSDQANDNIVLECWYKHAKVHEVSLSRKTFNKNFFEMNIARFGTLISWRFVQIKEINQDQFETVKIDKEYKFEFNLEEADTSKITTQGIWLQRFSNKPEIFMEITDAQTRWEHTKYTQNIVNFFQDGDIVEIDIVNRELRINGVVNNTLNIVGNQWEGFRLPIGSSFIKPIVSDYALMPQVTCAIRQSYI